MANIFLDEKMFGDILAHTKKFANDNFSSPVTFSNESLTKIFFNFIKENSSPKKFKKGSLRFLKIINDKIKSCKNLKEAEIICKDISYAKNLLLNISKERNILSFRSKALLAGSAVGLAAIKLAKGEWGEVFVNIAGSIFLFTATSLAYDFNKKFSPKDYDDVQTEISNIYDSLDKVHLEFIKSISKGNIK